MAKKEKLPMDEQRLADKCGQILQELWEETVDADDSDFFADEKVLNDIKTSLISPTKTYHYVLLTQLLAKVASPELDCRSVQANNFPYPGAFDARTVAHGVVVPFDAENQNVLGGSAEPYVSKPLRLPGILPEYRASQKNKEGWDALSRILTRVEEADSSEQTATWYLRQLLREIFRLTAVAKVEYPIPNRISLYRTIELINRFTAERSGGDRLEVVATALFRAIGLRLGIYDEVRREKVNSSDASSGMAGDIECRMSGKIVLVVEVRDKIITLTQVENSVLKARTAGVTELLFIAEKGVVASDSGWIAKKKEQEFNHGQNVYSATLADLVSAFTVLIGEAGRTDFIRQVGLELERLQSNIVHRKAWANLLRSL